MSHRLVAVVFISDQQIFPATFPAKSSMAVSVRHPCLSPTALVEKALTVTRNINASGFFSPTRPSAA